MNDTHTTPSSSSPWAALPVLLAGAFMVVLDFFIVNVALPTMQVDLHAGSSTLIWVVAGYGLSFAVCLVLAGRLGDELGRRRLFLLGIGLFAASSAACGAAGDPVALVAARVVQGAAGAIVMPQVLSIIGTSFTGDDYPRALSIYGVVLGLAAVGGQIIGGALVALDPAGLSWRACFLINVPVGLIALAGRRPVPESRAPIRAPLDLAGAGLLAVGLLAVLVPLSEGQSTGWPLWTWVSLALSPAVLAAFALRQSRVIRRGGIPLLDLRLFAQRAFSAGLLAQVALACAQAAFFVYLALYLQQGRGMSALAAGLLFTVLAVAYVAVSGPAPALTARFGRRVVAAGGVCLAGGLGLLAVVVADIGRGGSWGELVPGLMLVGAGIGLCYTPLTSIVLSRLDPNGAGAASGAMTTVQQVGYAVGVALTGVIFFAARRHGIAHAFVLSLLELAALGACVLLATRLLPAPTRAGAPALASQTAT
ncbi:MAG: MFS transporter [Solirubrobacterales bacterium]|nr:MFS transporter [Solirubrobacterales bacterium]MBV9716972.1 MFS transporter [Solirubrobacterales bacterium]